MLARKLSHERLLAPLYHVISNAHLPHVKHLLPVRSTALFERDLDFFLKNFTPISLQTLLDWLNHGSPLPRNPLILSTDDGLSENRDIIAPACLRKGVPATFFLTTGFLDNQKLFYRHKASLLIEAAAHAPESQRREVALRLAPPPAQSPPLSEYLAKALLSIPYEKADLLDGIAPILAVNFNDYLKTNRPYLTSDNVRSLLRQGFSIGAHSIDHPLYAHLTLEQQLHQTRTSVNFLTERFGLKHRAFAFPFSASGVSREFFTTLFDNNHVDIVFSTGTQLQFDGARVIPRHGMEPDPHAPAESIVRRLYGLSFQRRLIASPSGKQSGLPPLPNRSQP